MRLRNSKKITYFSAACGIFLLVTIVEIAFQNREGNPSEHELKFDFLVAETTPKEIALIFERSCYDCHSEPAPNTVFSKIPPMSWFITSHRARGLAGLNLSRWNSPVNRVAKYRNAMRTAMIFDIEHGRMPPAMYSFFERSRKLTVEEKKRLIAWLYSLEFSELNQ